ncbi:MAG: hypothetical protein Q8J78_07530 [Moraxellaceae bacterium]|nr:hypothetical protein [Moraxellaceae bacterium]
MAAGFAAALTAGFAAGLAGALAAGLAAAGLAGAFAAGLAAGFFGAALAVVFLAMAIMVFLSVDIPGQVFCRRQKAKHRVRRQELLIPANWLRYIGDLPMASNREEAQKPCIQGVFLEKPSAPALSRRKDATAAPRRALHTACEPLPQALTPAAVRATLCV